MNSGVKTRMTTRKPQAPATAIEPGSGNVFADLGLPNASEHLAKAELARQICALIGRQKLTQVRAAALLGVDQPKVSALLRGRLDGFSLERLFRFLNALGRDVEIIVPPANRLQSTASVRVTSRF